MTLAVLLFSCKKENSAEPLNESFNTSQATLLSQASFIAATHPTSGNVKLYTQNGINTLVFENFKTDSGPDLRVYLSKSIGNSDFKDLGVLKSTKGNFNYVVSNAINTGTYKYVLIWCKDFSVLFGSATLQ